MPYQVNDGDNMPPTGKVVVCCNHISNSDPIRLAFSQRRQIFYMSKSELFKNKAFGLILSGLGAFPVQRGKGDMSAINRAQELLQNGQALGVFIEGTRSKTGEPLQPKAGAVMLAYKNNAPILPCCITPKSGGVPKAFEKCMVSFGKLIQPEELGIERGTGTEFRNASRFVMNKIIELRERDLKAFEKM
ncbi:1-acyl-sn-glycerol-3-phosphate acyltransferase [Caproiciproducens galactitolivorans]|uniref:1-acyl-sn-glycerol-3-phosphate acyltransferase n=1 Tax=Caproiciproducens galactitolivorans TaxID=642589 RepID=A0A4Z0YGN4_9FIRM|nr:lysophospholipid acyltransferase family protein [Caproiciproducens galactitolivorans]QEY33946.1 1-acyl-sn-glycerol-3-phosphate acyltransferase [Caproiciproducens galactitolivorans]TGJ76092.1 1-acyl-sn-glycerol-3-phosphate acyltransferase [Caproiciproducens galactitolivorans]